MAPPTLARSQKSKSQKVKESGKDINLRANPVMAKAHKKHLIVPNSDAICFDKSGGAGFETDAIKCEPLNSIGRSGTTPPAKRNTEIVSGFSTPQRTLTPQSSCTDLESASSHGSSLHDVEPDAELVCEGFQGQVLPAWLQPTKTSNPTLQFTRDSLRSRGQQTGTTTFGTNQEKDSFARSSLRARGKAVLAGVRDARSCRPLDMLAPSMREDQGVTAVPWLQDSQNLWQSETFAPHPGHAWFDFAQAFQMPGTTVAFANHTELPMKVDLSSLASSGIYMPPGLSPPPGL